MEKRMTHEDGETDEFLLLNLKKITLITGSSFFSISV